MRLCRFLLCGGGFDIATPRHARIELLCSPLDFIKLEHERFKIIVDSNFSRLRNPDVQQGEILDLSFGRELIMCLVNRV